LLGSLLSPSVAPGLALSACASAHLSGEVSSLHTPTRRPSCPSVPSQVQAAPRHRPAGALEAAHRGGLPTGVFLFRRLNAMTRPAVWDRPEVQRPFIADAGTRKATAKPLAIQVDETTSQGQDRNSLDLGSTKTSRTFRIRGPGPRGCSGVPGSRRAEGLTGVQPGRISKGR
jgi:hypothetical protein